MKNLLIICLSLFLVNSLSAQTFKYIGADKCKICHNKPNTGEQYNKWVKSPHAMALKSLSSPASLEYAKKNVVLVEIDFPRRKPQSDELRRANKELAQHFDIEGYPTVILTDATGKVLSKEVGYQADTADSYIAKIEKLRKK